MKVTLLNPPSDTYRSSEEHLGLASLKAFMQTNGINAEIVDAYLLGLGAGEVASKVIQDPDEILLGVSPSLDSLKYAVRICQIVKAARPDVKICWGGHLVTFSADTLMAQYPEIDFIVQGEGEITFLALLEKLSGASDMPWSEIDGIVYRNVGHEVVTNGPRSFIDDLDTLPFPDRSLTEIASDEGALVNISGSRMSDGMVWRGRSAKHIVDEITELVKHGYKNFKFVDDSFFGPGENWRERAFEFARLVLERNLEIRFRISARVSNIDSVVFGELKRAGLYSLSLGVESGIQRAPDTFGKGTTVEESRDALEVLRDLNIITLVEFIGFDSHTTLGELEENLRFLGWADFALTDLVSKLPCVHTNDTIIKGLIYDGILDERDFPNHTYTIGDDRAERVLSHLKTWNSYNCDLYYLVSDPLTDPRLTSPEEEVELREMHQRLREIDLLIFETVVKMVKDGCLDAEILKELEHHRAIFAPEWKNIKYRFNLLMESRNS